MSEAQKTLILLLVFDLNLDKPWNYRDIRQKLNTIKFPAASVKL